MQEPKQRPYRKASYGLLSLLTRSTSLYNSGPPEWRLGPSPSIINQENAPRTCVHAGQSAGGALSTKIPSHQVIPAPIKLTESKQENLIITLMLHITKKGK